MLRISAHSKFSTLWKKSIKFSNEWKKVFHMVENFLSARIKKMAEGVGFEPTGRF